MGKFDAIRNNFQKNDNVKVISTYGEFVGAIDDLGEDYVVLKTKKGQITTLDSNDIKSVIRISIPVVSPKKELKKQVDEPLKPIISNKGNIIDSEEYQRELDDINLKLQTETSLSVRANLLQKKGEHCTTLGKNSEALSAYKELIKVCEELLVPDTRLGHFYSVYANLIKKTGGKKEDVEKYAKIALRLNPKSPNAQAVLGTKVSIGVEKNAQNTGQNIDILIQNNQFEEAIVQIDKQLLDYNDLISQNTLLTKKAQCYNSLGKLSEAKEVYFKLIRVKEKIKVSSGNLSQFYMIYAHLVAQTENPDNALKYAEKAYQLNPNNNAAANLIERINNGTYSFYAGNLDLIIDNDNTDEIIVISPMIDFDIAQCQFTNEEIIRNNGKPTRLIADNMLEKAKESKDIDISDRYPLYLETAKAYQVLGLESDYDKYLESVAYYAMLKGNTLYLRIRDMINNGNKQIKELTRLKDSACSYYLEALNLLSNINNNYLVVILNNYLKLNIAISNLESSKSIEFSGQFKATFSKYLNSKSINDVEIVYKTLISIGASNINVWNKLVTSKNGVGSLTGILNTEEKRKDAFNLINQFEQSQIDINLSISVFFKRIFKNRKNRNTELKKIVKDLQTKKLELNLIDSLIDLWNQINIYTDLLYPTDIEIKNGVDILLSLLKPYISRNEKERTNLLIQAQRNIEHLLMFINSNVTYYGRAFYYPLLKQWLSDIQSLLDTKISQTLPKLVVSVDPHYILTDLKGIDYVTVIIKNEGESTADGYILDVEFINPNSEERFSVETINIIEELSVGDTHNRTIVMPIAGQDIMTVIFNITTQYQQKQLDVIKYEYTIEKEPQSELTYDDIKWQDGKIPPEQFFKGRQKLISKLVSHYLSIERDKSYILYGLTRVGKSSILTYLKKHIEQQNIIIDNHSYKIVAFELNFSDAADYKAEDFWYYVLRVQIYDNLKNYLPKEIVDSYCLPSKPRAKDLPIVLHFLKENYLYPLFLIDEFSFIKDMIDNKKVSTAFLHTLRQYSFDGLASFIYAGTYDIKELIRNPNYGITGQLVNALDLQINEIAKQDAEELMNVIDNKLSFTQEAREHIHKLSGDIPYFIQMICKYCGYYAVENRRRYIGYPELEYVIKLLTGEIMSKENDSLVKELSINCFLNNQYSAADPKPVNVLLSSIAYFNKGVINNPRGISLPELQKLWSERGINDYRPKLAESIELLLEKKVLIQNKDDDNIVYTLAVDLFRRWWYVHHRDIDLEITTLQ